MILISKMIIKMSQEIIQLMKNTIIKKILHFLLTLDQLKSNEKKYGLMTK